MNLNPLLDVTMPPPSAPLDRTVGDGGGDGAFADVLSQYGSANAGIPTNQSAPATAATDQTCGGTPQASEAALADAEAAELAVLVPTQVGGEPLPASTAQGGQPLPPDPTAAMLDVATGPAPRPVDDPTDDSRDGPSDPGAAAAIVAALIGAANAPQGGATQTPQSAAAPQPVAAQPIANPTAPVADVAEAAPIVQSSADDAATADTVGTSAADTASDPTAFERIRVQLDRLQRRNDAPTNAPRAQTASAAAASGAAAVGGALTPTLRALLRGRDEPTSLAANVAHAARGNADVANAAAVKPVAMPLAALDPNVHKDAPVARDDGDTMVRVDAVQARSGGADALRDAAPVRLGDLAQQHAQRFAGELADRVLVMRNQRLDGATVTLEPRDLGRIDIQVRLQADTTHVAFTTQHAAVRDALEGQLPRLRSMLEEAGLSLGAVDVAHAGARNATGGDAGSARSHEAPRAAPTADADTADAPAAWRPRASTSLIDLHA